MEHHFLNRHMADEQTEAEIEVSAVKERIFSQLGVAPRARCLVAKSHRLGAGVDALRLPGRLEVFGNSSTSFSAKARSLLHHPSDEQKHKRTVEVSSGSAQHSVDLKAYNECKQQQEGAHVVEISPQHTTRKGTRSVQWTNAPLRPTKAAAPSRPLPHITKQAAAIREGALPDLSAGNTPPIELPSLSAYRRHTATKADDCNAPLNKQQPAQAEPPTRFERPLLTPQQALPSTPDPSLPSLPHLSQFRRQQAEPPAQFELPLLRAAPQPLLPPLPPFSRRTANEGSGGNTPHDEQQPAQQADPTAHFKLPPFRATSQQTPSLPSFRPSPPEPSFSAAAAHVVEALPPGRHSSASSQIEAAIALTTECSVLVFQLHVSPVAFLLGRSVC